MVCTIDTAAHVRWAKYVKPRRRHAPEALIAAIDGHAFVWVWSPQYWDEFLRRLAAQTQQDTPLGADDVVALIKLRLQGVRK